MWGNELETDSVTIGELEQLAADIAASRKKYDDQKIVLSKIGDEVDELEGQMKALLSKAGKTSYASNSGTVSITTRETIRIPGDVESKRLLFDYLRKANLFDEMVSVNSQTLNSFYKSEKQAAFEKGDYNFQLPGVGEPSRQEILSFRKK